PSGRRRPPAASATLPSWAPSSGSCSASPPRSCGSRSRAGSPAARPCSLLGGMLEGKRVAVVVPAYNEERLIAETITGIPPFVYRVYVVDDASIGGTPQAPLGR